MRRMFVSTLAGLLFAAAVAGQGNTVSVQGNVNSPGTYTVNADGTMTLRDAIRRAGGLLADSGATATLYRADERGTLHEVKVPLQSILDRKTPDLPLKPGDVIYVPGPGAKPLSKRVIDDRVIP